MDTFARRRWKVGKSFGLDGERNTRAANRWKASAQKDECKKDEYVLGCPLSTSI